MRVVNDADIVSVMPSVVSDNDIIPLSISQQVLAPAGGLTVPQGFVDGAATNRNLHKRTPRTGTLGKALDYIQDAAVDIGEYALTAPATMAAGVNRGVGSLQAAFSYAPQGGATEFEYSDELGYRWVDPTGLAALRQHDEAGVQAGISRMDESDLVMQQIESEKPMNTLPGRIMRKGLFQVSNMAPTMAMAAVPVVGPDAALMAMSMSSGADPIKKARELNLDDAQTADYIAKTVGPEYLGEKASFGTLLKALGGKQPFVKTALQLIGTELGGEIATSHFQFAADKAYEQPGLTREQRDKIYNDIVTGKTLQADAGLRSEWLDVMKDTAEGVAGMVGITAGGGKLYRKAADKLRGIPSPTREQLDAAEQQQKQAGVQNDYNRYFEQQGYGPTAGLDQAAAGTGQTAAPGGEQGGGQSVAAAPAAAEEVPASQADYELQAAAELAAQQPVEDGIPDFIPPTILPQQAAAVAPAVQPPAQPAGTLTKAAMALNPYNQLATQPFAQAPEQQPVTPEIPVVRGAGSGLNTLQAPSEIDLAMEWGRQQLTDPANSKFDLQNMQAMLKSPDPNKTELLRYWRAFTGQKKQPAALSGLTVARDSAPSPAVPAAVAPAEVQQPPTPVAEAPSSPVTAGEVDQETQGQIDRFKMILQMIDRHDGDVTKIPRAWAAAYAGVINALSEKGIDVDKIHQDYKAGQQKPEKTDPVSEATPAPTPTPDTKTAERRKGEVGMKLEAGERVLTSSGRLTTEFPKISFTTNKTAANTLKRVDQWLMDNAIEEARSRGDKFNQRQFAANREKPSQADKDSAEQYLYGEKQPAVVPDILKPLVSPDKGQALTRESFLSDLGLKPINKDGDRYFENTTGRIDEQGVFHATRLTKREADLLEEKATAKGYSVKRKNAQQAVYKRVDGELDQHFVDVPDLYDVSIDRTSPPPAAQVEKPAEAIAAEKTEVTGPDLSKVVSFTHIGLSKGDTGSLVYGKAEAPASEAISYLEERIVMLEKLLECVGG